MKKKILFILCSILCLSFIGCGEEEVIVIPDTVEEIIVTVDSSSTIKSPIDMTKEELLSLNAQEIQEMIEIYLPNYRDAYGIDEDRVLTDGDWLELRDYIYYQIYGEIAPSQPIEVEETIEIDTSDPNWIYYSPTVEFLTNMTTEEFAEYMNGMSQYYGVEEEVDFTQYDEEKLNSIRETTIQELAVDYKEETEETEETEVTE